MDTHESSIHLPEERIAHRLADTLIPWQSSLEPELFPGHAASTAVWLEAEIDVDMRMRIGDRLLFARYCVNSCGGQDWSQRVRIDTLTRLLPNSLVSFLPLRQDGFSRGCRWPGRQLHSNAHTKLARISI